MTRILLINPNISDSVSELIRAEAQRSASAGTTVEVLTAPFGVAYIETRFEALVGAYATAQLAAEHHARFDAVVVAAVGDPGLPGLREALPCPVTGLTEAALASACLLGQRDEAFALVALHAADVGQRLVQAADARQAAGEAVRVHGLPVPGADAL
jgi:Asp/Glu/hydantoin racemase